MRILHTVSSLFPETGGPARSVPGLAGAQVREGTEVFLWAKDVPTEYVPPLGVTLVVGGLEDCASLMRTVDIVHDHGLWLPLNNQIAKLSKRTNCKRVVSPRGMLEPWALNHRKWKKRLAWWLYQKRDLQSASGLHATAHQEAEQLNRLALTAPIFVAANGVDLPAIAPVLDGLSIKPKIKTALFLSRIHPKKGLEMLIGAWAKLRPVGWQMRVVGPDEGGHLSALKAQVAAAGLQEVWSFESSLEGDLKWQAMSGADIFILPSFSENFGIVVAESLACRTPVITTTGTPWKGLRENQCGWWVAPESKSIIDALDQATKMDIEKLQEMGDRGRSWVAQDFTWPAIADKAIHFYESILASN